MTEVVVTRRGQTTIPAEIRRKYGIVEGTRLEIVDKGGTIVIRKKRSTMDLIGTGSVDAKKAHELLSKIREEDDR
ncbi:MAG: AbrB/MazE/SpoVT family DNA-binding domain-containing protein [Thermoproteota archaeon]|nr:AbrB/MazE/SpoVT family DNA-binding domain-containing protein [Candidatus Brockarchaeota archaeon]